MSLIQDLLKPYARRSTITLASGQTSDWYVDVKSCLLSSDGLLILGSHVNKLLPRECNCVAGIGLGGTLLVAAVAAQRANTHSLIVRQEVKDHGTRQQVEGLAAWQSTDVVYVLEDVVTTGQSVEQATTALQAAGVTVSGVCAVVDRRPVKASMLAGLPFAALVTEEDLS